MRMGERRSRRFETRGAALDSLLEACRRSAELEALVLADDHGFIVAAAAAPHVNAAQIASVLPEPSRREGCSLVHSVSFAHGSARLHLGAVGAGPRAAAPLPAALEGAKRILAAM